MIVGVVALTESLVRKGKSSLWALTVMDAMDLIAKRRVVVDRHTAEAEAVATVVAESTGNSVRYRQILIAGRRVVEHARVLCGAPL